MTSADTRREPVLDGVRGIAILLVLFHHFVLYSGFGRQGGFDRYISVLGDAMWAGVDVFFVLSGFLITGILYDTKGSQSFFRTFYGRRTLRIFPLYYGVLAVVFVLWPLAVGAPLFGPAEGGQLWYWTYVSNVDVGLNGWREPLEIGHFWSLAVEEQFYLVWPLVVFAFGRQRLLQITIGCFAVALALRWSTPFWLPPTAVEAPYTLMPMRMDALAAGGFVALLARGPRGWAVFAGWPLRVFWVALGGIAAIFLWQRGLGQLDPVVRTAGYSLLAISTASFIALAVRSGERSLLRKALVSRVLVTLGTYSYGLYVFHHMVVLWMRGRAFGADDAPTLWGSQVPGLLLFSVVAMGASSALAFLSWHLWEMPFLRLKRFFRYQPPPGAESVGGGHFGDAPVEPQRSVEGPQR